MSVTTILIKRNAVSGTIPAPSSFTQGELALNFGVGDGGLYYLDASGSASLVRAGTASLAQFSVAATTAVSSTFASTSSLATRSLTSSLAATASFAVTAAFAMNGAGGTPATASYALTASNLNTIPPTASFAVTAAFALNAGAGGSGGGSGSANFYTIIPFIQLWKSDAVIQPIPSGSVEIDQRLRRKANFNSVNQARLQANMSSAPSTSANFDVNYSVDGGLTWALLGSTLSMIGSGAIVSKWVPITSSQQTDVLLSPVTIGSGSGNVMFSFLELEVTSNNANNFIEYRSPGTFSFIVPGGISSITIDAVGGGGGGANGGGGGAEGVVGAVFTVTPGGTINITVGVGGAGMPFSSSAGGATIGTVGGKTIVGALFSVSGGNGGGTTDGNGSLDGANGGGGLGGNGTNYQGGNGAIGTSSSFNSGLRYGGGGAAGNSGAGSIAGNGGNVATHFGGSGSSGSPIRNGGGGGASAFGDGGFGSPGKSDTTAPVDGLQGSGFGSGGGGTGFNNSFFTGKGGDGRGGYVKISW